MIWLLFFLNQVFFWAGICEMSFPETFSWVELLSAQYPNIWKYDLWIALGEIGISVAILGPAFRLDTQKTLKFLETWFRIGLGGMFVAASLFKMDDPRNFALLVAQYQFLPQFLVNLFALYMPILEFIIGVALVFSPFTRENATLLSIMFVMFIIALFQAVIRDLGITCGCFELEGAHDKADAWISLVRDIILLPPSLWLCFRPNKSLFQLWKHD